MAKLKLTGKELRDAGFPEGPVIGVVMNVIAQHYFHDQKKLAIRTLGRVLKSPEKFVDDQVMGLIAKSLIPVRSADKKTISLNVSGVHFEVFGPDFIEEGAIQQMSQAARLPVSIAGALMPDAHSGYGLPIGGVLATRNAVIPYGVGVDIGCRMCLSIFDIHPDDLIKRESFYLQELQRSTLFGSGQEFSSPSDHPIIDAPAFNSLPILKGLQDRAWKQLGSSGSGNHFVEFGVVEIGLKDAVLNVQPGVYLGLLSHSGSRGLGANVANHYTRIAKEKRQLPPEAVNLSWLGMDEEEGQEYWMAMNLAGEYASACHHVIHEKIADALGRSPIKRVENHHNFAWKELHNGEELIVHRKGATPAGTNVPGIIPGSMTAPGFIVKGKGHPGSLSSASHGAGRKMSRTKALEAITRRQLDDYLQSHNVKVIGGGLDEAPHAYKNIEEVMKSQEDLVAILGRFIPKIVRMDGTAAKQWRRSRKQSAP